MLDRKLMICVLSMFVVVSLAIFGIQIKANAQDKPIVLKAITPWPKSYYGCAPLFEFQKRAEQRLKGKLTINYLGSNEVVPSFEQFEALRTGVVDMALGAATFYTGQISEAQCLIFAEKTASSLRKSGFYDLLRKIHLEKGDVIYLANVGGSPGKGFRFFSNVKLEKLDFTGLKMRVSPVYVDAVKALGGIPISIPPAEHYSAVERGIVNGYGAGYAGIEDYGLESITKYIIDHPFYTLNHSIQFNANVWKKLPEDIRKTLEEIGQELEVWTSGYIDDHLAKADKFYEKAGMKLLNFGPEGDKIMHAAAYDAGLKSYLEKNPKYGPQLIELMQKAE